MSSDHKSCADCSKALPSQMFSLQNTSDNSQRIPLKYNDEYILLNIKICVSKVGYVLFVCIIEHPNPLITHMWATLALGDIDAHISTHFRIYWGGHIPQYVWGGGVRWDSRLPRRFGIILSVALALTPVKLYFEPTQQSLKRFYNGS